MQCGRVGGRLLFSTWSPVASRQRGSFSFFPARPVAPRPVTRPFPSAKVRQNRGPCKETAGRSGILFSNTADTHRLTANPSRLVPTLTHARLLHTGLPFADTRHTQTKKIRFLRHQHAELQGETCRFSTRKTGAFDPKHAMFLNPKSLESRVHTGFEAFFAPTVSPGCRRVSVVFIPARSAQARDIYNDIFPYY